MPKPSSNIGLRPYLSDTGPQTSCEAPKTKSKPDKVNCACAMLAPKFAVIAGRAGKYRSVVTG